MFHSRTHEWNLHALSGPLFGTNSSPNRDTLLYYHEMSFHYVLLDNTRYMTLIMLNPHYLSLSTN